MSFEFRVYAELTDDNSKIEISFPYDPDFVIMVKEIPNARYDGNKKCWYSILSIEHCHEIRKAFGNHLSIGPKLSVWARREIISRKELISMATATDATLKRLPGVEPGLAKTLRADQRVGARFIAESPGVLIADEPGLGKTLEAIAGVYETEKVRRGPTLVIAPLSAVDNAWEKELLKWQGLPVFACTGTRDDKEETLADFATYLMESGLFDYECWVVVNLSMIQLIKDELGKDYIASKNGSCSCKASKTLHDHYSPRYPILHLISWENIIIDECHKGALRDLSKLTGISLKKLKLNEGGRRIALSGTPMTSSSLDLFGILQWLRPDIFTSKWAWAEQWCEIDTSGPYKKIGGINHDKEMDFFLAHTPYILRRKKSEILKDLPPKTFVDIWCHMGERQKRQYDEMAKDASAKLGNDSRINATSILAEFTRLRQFSNAFHTEMDSPDLKDSSKYLALIEKLTEEGIFDEEGISKTVIFSQFKTVADAIYNDLLSRNVACLKLTGDTKNRKQIVDSFQSDDGSKVLVMTTTAGGVSITLDRADSAHFMDETWTHAEQLQAEDRIHRASRNHNVTIYNYRNHDTIDEYIMGIVDMKESMSDFILDVRRRMIEKYCA